MRQLVLTSAIVLGLMFGVYLIYDTFIDRNTGEKEMTFESNKVKEYDELFVEPKPDPVKESFDTFQNAVDEYEKSLTGEGEHYWLESIRIKVQRKIRYATFPGFQDRYHIESDLSFRTREQYNQLDDIIEKVIELADEHLDKIYQTISFDTWEYTDNTPFLRGKRYTYKRK